MGNRDAQPENNESLGDQVTSGDAETTPNTEMTLIADLDLESLVELHENGSVKNLKDRRKDIYDLKLKTRK